MKVIWLFASMAASLSLPGWAAQSEAADISMAIYEGGLSVVNEARRITVVKGDSTLALNGLPDGVQPVTLVANFAAGSGLRLRGQRLLNSKHALLDDFFWENNSGYHNSCGDGTIDRARGQAIKCAARSADRIGRPDRAPRPRRRCCVALDIDADRAGPTDYRLS